MFTDAPGKPPAKRLVAGLLLASWLSGGCSALRYTNTVPRVDRHVRASSEGVSALAFKTYVLYPARDLLTLDWLWRLVEGDEAWNALGDGVADGSFVTNRPPQELTPDAVARGPCTMPPPTPPILVTAIKRAGGSTGFIGQDSLGRTFMFKLDHPDYPELGSSAAVIGSRILWALGYNVPPVFVVRIQGTGDERFDGRRAAASLYVKGARGYFKFDWFRYRREVRALRMACAWINDSDRIGTNTLVIERGGPARYFLIDFNSCLGSWNGRPKEPWRGGRHAWALPELLLGVLTLGLVTPPYDHDQPIISDAVGRFDARLDPLRWRSQMPNTAFERMTEGDLRWMAARIARLGRRHVAAIVTRAELTDPADAGYLIDTLMKRRGRILRAANLPDGGTAK